MEPLLKFSSQLVRRMVVVLPHPDGPNKTTTSPFSMVKETLSRAVIAPAPAPKILVALSYVIIRFSPNIPMHSDPYEFQELNLLPCKPSVESSATTKK
jgi:hypothetical protein